jgi:hypothetical protein
MKGKFSSVIRLFVLAGLLALGMTPALSTQAAPPAATLTPQNVQSNGTYTVAITNPTAGNIERLALQVAAQGNPRPKLVRFSVIRQRSDGSTDIVYERDEKTAPFCIAGDSGGKCTVKQAGDRWETGKRMVSTGNYDVEIGVFSDPTSETPDWSGSVPIKLVTSKVVADEPNYGTGQGNGPLAEIHDPFYREAGQKQIRVEAKVFSPNAKPMPKENVRHVEFRVRNSNGDDVYVNNELNPPYCIFGEESDGKTCRTLKAGDTWPQSNTFNDETNSKSDDDSIPRTTIEPGEYRLSIDIRTGNGTWGSSGAFTILP